MPTQTKNWTQKQRLRIEASEVIDTLIDCACGKMELSATQLRANEVLLRKVLPDLKAIEVTGEATVTIPGFVIKHPNA